MRMQCGYSACVRPARRCRPAQVLSLCACHAVGPIGIHASHAFRQHRCMPAPSSCSSTQSVSQRREAHGHAKPVTGQRSWGVASRGRLRGEGSRARRADPTVWSDSLIARSGVRPRTLAGDGWSLVSDTRPLRSPAARCARPLRSPAALARCARQRQLSRAMSGGCGRVGGNARRARRRSAHRNALRRNALRRNALAGSMHASSARTVRS